MIGTKGVLHNDCQTRPRCSTCSGCLPSYRCITFTPEESSYPTGCCENPISAVLRFVYRQRNLGNDTFVFDVGPDSLVDGQCVTDGWYNSHMKCGNATIFVDINVKEEYGICQLTWRIQVTGIGNDETVEYVTDYDTNTLYMEVGGLSGTLLLGNASMFVNPKYRRSCPPEQMGALIWSGPDEVVPTTDLNDCHECPPCLNCRCLPTRLCIGYRSSNLCDKSMEWISVEINADGTAYAPAVFTITDEDYNTVTRTVTIDLCHHMIRANTIDQGGFYFDPPTDLFSYCLYSIDVAEADWSLAESMEYTTGSRGGCTLSDLEKAYDVRRIEDSAAQPPRIHYERLYIQNGSCGCPDPEIEAAICPGGCPSLDYPPTLGCPIPHVYATLIAPGCGFDGDSWELNYSAEFVSHEECIFQRYGGGVNVQLHYPPGCNNSLVIGARLHYNLLPPECRDDATPIDMSRYRMRVTVADTCFTTLPTRPPFDMVLSPIASVCGGAPQIDFEVPNSAFVGDTITNPGTQCGCCLGNPTGTTIIRITL